MPPLERSAAADDAQLGRVLDAIDRTLAGRVCSVVLYGSAARGGLRPDSDLDLLVIVEDALDPVAAAALVDALLDVSGRRARVAPGRPVEVTVAALGDLVPWRFPPVQQLLYGEWLRDELEAGRHDPPAPNPDLAILLRQAQGAHRVLRGHGLAELLEPVPDADVRRGIRESVDPLMADLEGDERNVLLTLARMWATLETGRILAKDEAAGWAAARLCGVDGPDGSPTPEGSAATARALATAAAGYCGDVDDRWEEHGEVARHAAADLAARIAAT